jgi:hypothetical protein
MEIILLELINSMIGRNYDQEEVKEFFTIFLEGLLMRNDNPRMIEVLHGILEILADNELD